MTDPVTVLSDEDNERIFRQQIVPMFLDGAPPQTQPVVVIVGGQTGAGKTAVTATVREALARTGGFININMDFYNPMHPQFHRWQHDDPATASAKVRPDGERWWNKAQEYAITHRCNVVLESAMRSESEFEDIARRFQDSGFRVEVALVAVPEALSRLGILHRYWSEIQQTGHGRFIDPSIHDECYQGVLRGATAVDTEGLAHTAFAFRRNGEVVYANTRDTSGAWHHPPRLAEAVEVERHRTWNEPEKTWYTRNSQSLRDRIDPQWHRELNAIDATAAPLLAAAPAPAAAKAFALSTRQALTHQPPPATRSTHSRPGNVQPNRTPPIGDLEY